MPEIHGRDTPPDARKAPPARAGTDRPFGSRDAAGGCAGRIPSRMAATAAGDPADGVRMAGDALSTGGLPAGTAARRRSGSLRERPGHAARAIRPPA